MVKFQLGSVYEKPIDLKKVYLLTIDSQCF